jgi:hypothetical protein
MKNAVEHLNEAGMHAKMFELFVQNVAGKDTHAIDKYRNGVKVLDDCYRDALAVLTDSNRL